MGVEAGDDDPVALVGESDEFEWSAAPTDGAYNDGAYNDGAVTLHDGDMTSWSAQSPSSNRR